MVYNQDINLDLDTRQPNIIVGAKQYDNNSRTITATILENGKPLIIPSNALASYRIKKPNGRLSWKNATIDYDKSQVKITFNSEDLSTSGRNIVDVVLTIGSFTLGTTNFILDIQAAPNITDIEQDSESLSHLEEIVRQANDMIEQAQAWAEGRRGDNPVIVDSYEVGSPEGVSVSLNFNTFKANITPKTSGSTITYIFTYGANGWTYQYNAQIVDMTALGFTITPTEANKPTYGDIITVVASYTDDTYQNNAKYYSEVAASAANTLTSTIVSVNSALSNKLDIPLSQASAPSNPKIGDFWVDNNAQFVFSGEIIGASNIKTSAVLGHHIYPNSISAIHIADATIGSNHIQNLSIYKQHITEGAVQSSHIYSGAIWESKIATSAVTTNKIAPSAITAAKIDTSAITTDKINLGAVTSVKIAESAVYSNNIVTSAITTDKIDLGAVTLQKLDPNFMIGGVIANSAASGKLYVERFDGTPRGFILFAGRAARGLVCYNITADGNSEGSSFVYFRSADSSDSNMLKTGTTLATTSSNGRLRLDNQSNSAISFLVINISGTISVRTTNS